MIFGNKILVKSDAAFMRGAHFSVKSGPVPGFHGGSEYSVTPGMQSTF